MFDTLHDRSKPKGPPLWAVDAAKQLSRGMTQVQRRMAPAAATLVEMVSGVWRPYAIGLIAELGIADLLANGPRDVASLARDTGTHEEALYRILHPLAHDGILAEPSQRTFALTYLSQPLRSDHPQSMLQTVRQTMSQWNMESWRHLKDAVRTGEPVFARLHGDRDVWTWFAEEAQEEGRVFHDSMMELTRLALPLIVAAHDFSRYGRIVDVGGGRGTLIAGLLKAYPSLRGAILDFKGAIEDTPQHLEHEGVRDRCELIEGDMLAGLPPGFDLYIMKHILHGMTDEPMRDLLRSVREALTPNARFIAIEMLIPDDRGGTYPAFLDFQMLVASGGRERSASQYRALFAENGLRLVEVLRTASPISLLVVERA